MGFVKKNIAIENHSFIVEQIDNLDKLVDEISDNVFNEDERLPYWAELWPSALALSSFILKNKYMFFQKKILELGCGLGLTTMTLQKTNPVKLLATDYEQAALDNTRRNFELNHLTPPDLKILDWRDTQPNPQYDFIVASDILYEKRFFIPLVDVFKNFLLHYGTVVISEPNRAIARSFFEMLEKNGFKIVRRQNCEIKQENIPVNVTIYCINYV